MLKRIRSYPIKGTEEIALDLGLTDGSFVAYMTPELAEEIREALAGALKELAEHKEADQVPEGVTRG